MTSRCPFAEWIPWRYPSAEPGNVGKGTYYAGQNQPQAVVLHIAEGYAHTARAWALIGKYPKSWHFTVSRSGHIMQHLESQDGGFHAGISIDQAQRHPPTWTLWKGPNINVNKYTIGIEHEGFYQGYPWPEAQLEASKRLCQWISSEWGIPYDREHFPSHAEIDVVNRVNDFAIPSAREAHYAFLFGEEQGMTQEQIARLERVERLLAGNGIKVDGQTLKNEDALNYLDGAQTSAYQQIWDQNSRLGAHTSNHPSGGDISRDDVIDAHEAAIASLNGETK